MDTNATPAQPQYDPTSLLGQMSRAATALDDVSERHANVVRDGIASLNTVCTDRDNRMAQVSEQAARALDLREQITTLQRELDAARATNTDVRREHAVTRQQIAERDERFAKFGDQVRALAIQTAAEQEWCDDGLNDALMQLGLDIKQQPRVEFTVRVTTEFVVRARPSGSSTYKAEDVDEAWLRSSINRTDPRDFQMDDDFEDVDIIDDCEEAEFTITHVSTVDPREDN